MTTRPRLYTSSKQALGGVAAGALFVLLTAVFLTGDFADVVGFGGKPVTATIGYAMFNMVPEAGALPSEGFLVTFEIIDVVLIAALAAAVMLARRQGAGGGLPLTDGGRDTTEEGGDD